MPAAASWLPSEHMLHANLAHERRSSEELERAVARAHDARPDVETSEELELRMRAAVLEAHEAVRERQQIEESLVASTAALVSTHLNDPERTDRAPVMSASLFRAIDASIAQEVAWLVAAGASVRTRSARFNAQPQPRPPSPPPPPPPPVGPTASGPALDHRARAPPCPPPTRLPRCTTRAESRS